MPHLAGDDASSLLQIQQPAGKVIIKRMSTDYGDECQHVLWQDTQWFKSVFIHHHQYLLKIYHDPKILERKRCMTKRAAIFLFIAIVVGEVIATISLKLSD